MSGKAKVSGIYKILNTVTSDFYIGSSKDCAFRWCRHRWLLKQGIHHNQHLQKAWVKYGPDVFTFEVLIEVQAEQLVETEQSFLDQYLPPYNISKSADRPSGTLGLHWVMPEDAKRRISAAHMGRPKSEAWKASMRKPKSEATKAKMRKPKSDEHRQKLAAHIVKVRGPGRVKSTEKAMAS